LQARDSTRKEISDLLLNGDDNDKTRGFAVHLKGVQSAMEPPLTPMVTTNGNGSLNHEPSPESTNSSFDTSIFRTYLQALLPPLIGSSPEELYTLFNDEFDERVMRFAGEGGDVIYVVKSKDEIEGRFLDLFLPFFFAYSRVKTTQSKHTPIPSHRI
jgi:hypothetical protein